MIFHFKGIEIEQSMFIDNASMQVGNFLHGLFENPWATKLEVYMN